MPSTAINYLNFFAKYFPKRLLFNFNVSAGLGVSEDFVERFSSLPSYTNVKISPDGKAIYIGGYKEGNNVTGVHGFVMKFDAKGPSTGTFGTWVVGELETTGTYPWAISDAGGSERSQTTGAWTNYNRSTSDVDSDDYDINWSASTLTTVS